jgi:hypothetical protein
MHTSKGYIVPIILILLLLLLAGFFIFTSDDISKNPTAETPSPINTQATSSVSTTSEEINFEENPEEDATSTDVDIQATSSVQLNMEE